jgi:hypothetical protein
MIPDRQKDIMRLMLKKKRAERLARYVMEKKGGRTWQNEGTPSGQETPSPVLPNDMG